MKKELTILYAIVFIFILFYCFGMFFPDQFWSTHFIHFMPSVFQLLIVAGVFWFGVKMYRTNTTISLKPKALSSLSSIKIMGIITFVSMLCMLIFAMVYDFYGDAYKFNPFLDKIPPAIPKGTHEKFFTYKLTPWAGEGTILALVTYIAYYFQVTYKTAFIILDTIFGGLFVFTWLHFIHNFIKINVWKVILVLAGLTAPFMLIFFGHIEIYAPIIFFHLLWGYLTLLYIKSGKRHLLWLLTLVLLFNLKLHSISLLCIPALILLFWKASKGTFPNWKLVRNIIIIPITIVGAIIYFFIFEDHIDDRSLQNTAMAFDHIFLPLFTPEAPLDNYSLLSFNHIFDFFSMVFIWSPIAILIIIYFVFTKRKHINWNKPEVIITGLTLLLYIMFFFVVNPLLSMPIDWDLFSIPAPFLLIFVATIIMQKEKENPGLSHKILFAAGIITVLSLPAFIIHQSEKSLSHRLESVASYTYGTYYEWTAKIVDNAFSLDDKHHINRLERGQAFLDKLKPKARKGIDYEYSALLIDQGRYLLRVHKTPEKALSLFNLAQEYTPANNALLLSLEAHFELNQYQQAFMVSKKLIQQQFPNAQKAYKMSIHCGLMAKRYQETYDISKFYLQQWPQDATVQEVLQRLTNNDRIEELKFLFHNTGSR